MYQQLGNYRLIKRLGQGTFGDVWLGKHIHLASPAAIKILHGMATEKEVANFKKEAQALVNLKHLHIIAVRDFGIEAGSPYLVMDYAANGTLKDRHPAGSTVPLATVVSYVKQVAAALQYVHDRKIIHRDVKPANMLIDAEGKILLSDFGIYTVSHSENSLSKQDIAGTARYMAPEQHEGHAVSASDQYALGITVYEWLCGDVPFTGNPNALVWKHAMEAPPLLTGKAPHIPLAVEAVVMKALAKNPEERYARIQDFADALEEASRQTQTEIITEETMVCSVCGQQFQVIDAFCPACGASAEDTHAQEATYRATSTLLSQALPNEQPAVTTTDYSLPDTLQLVSSHEFDKVTSLAWSPDGTYIAVAAELKGGDKQIVTIYDTYTGKEVGFHSMETAYKLVDIAWSPDGKYLAAGSRTTLRAWDIQNGSVLYDLPQSDNLSYYDTYSSGNIAWSPDGKQIASLSFLTGRKRQIIVRDAQTGHPLRRYSYKNQTESRLLRWSPDSKQIVSLMKSGVNIHSNTGRIYKSNKNKRRTYTLVWSEKTCILVTKKFFPSDLQVRISLIVLLIPLILLALTLGEGLLSSVLTIPLGVCIDVSFLFFFVGGFGKIVFVASDVLTDTQMNTYTLGYTWFPHKRLNIPQGGNYIAYKEGKHPRKLVAVSCANFDRVYTTDLPEGKLRRTAISVDAKRIAITTVRNDQWFIHIRKLILEIVTAKK